jgi:hypothetical protein
MLTLRSVQFCHANNKQVNMRWRVHLGINSTSDVWKFCQNWTSRRSESNLANWTQIWPIFILCYCYSCSICIYIVQSQTLFWPHGAAEKEGPDEFACACVNYHHIYVEVARSLSSVYYEGQSAMSKQNSDTRVVLTEKYFWQKIR